MGFSDDVPSASKRRNAGEPQASGTHIRRGKAGTSQEAEKEDLSSPNRAASCDSADGEDRHRLHERRHGVGSKTSSAHNG